MSDDIRTDILAGRTALVTGASRGNGAAIARGLEAALRAKLDGRARTAAAQMRLALRVARGA